MTPYYDHGGITIYHGDCREILPPRNLVAAPSGSRSKRSIVRSQLNDFRRRCYNYDQNQTKTYS